MEERGSRPLEIRRGGCIYREGDTVSPDNRVDVFEEASGLELVPKGEGFEEGEIIEFNRDDKVKILKIKPGAVIAEVSSPSREEPMIVMIDPDHVGRGLK